MSSLCVRPMELERDPLTTGCERRRLKSLKWLNSRYVQLLCCGRDYLVSLTLERSIIGLSQVAPPIEVALTPRSSGLEEGIQSPSDNLECKQLMDMGFSRDQARGMEPCFGGQ